MKSLVLFASMVITAMSCSTKAAAPRSGSGSATAPASGSATAPASGTATGLPQAAVIKQGEEAWAVYFAVGDPEAKEFVAAKTRTDAMGFTLYPRDRNCDVTPAAPDKANDMLLSAYYSSESDAKLVATAFGQPAPWVGKVKTMCMDDNP